MRRLIIVLTILNFFPSWSWALGLGQAEVFSTLGQTLNARIPVLLAANEKAADISVQLASDIDFAKHEIPKPALLDELQFKLIDKAGKPFIHVTSSHDIYDPTLHFLLQLNSPAGKIVSSHTILLMPGKAADSSMMYGPVQPHETLWGIAAKLRPSQQVTITQTLVALFLANPEQFAQGNLNDIKVGKKLLIPSLNAIQAISQQQALAIIKEHKRAWLSPIKEPRPIKSANMPVDGSKVPVIAEQDAAPITVASTAKQQSQQSHLLLSAQKTIAELSRELEAAKHQQTELNHQLQAKESEITKLSNQIGELKHHMAAKSAETSVQNRSSFDRILIWPLVLLAVAIILAYLYKTKRLSLEKLHTLKWPVFFKRDIPSTVVPDSYYSNVQTQAESKQTAAQKKSIEPLEEAGIYFAYGRYEQAQRVLQNAIEEKPDKLDFKLKLLEVYAAKDDKAAFEQFATQLRPSLNQDKPELWQFIQDLHHKTWSDNLTAGEQPENIEPASNMEPEVTLSSVASEKSVHELNSMPVAEIELTDEDAIATKLEMARSCLEIGAIQDARKLLSNVRKYGDESQRKEAERLLERIS